MIVDYVSNGLQQVGRLIEDVVQKEVCLESLVLVAEVEGV